MHMLMDYVPDVAAFKELDFHGGDSYICAVSPPTFPPACSGRPNSSSQAKLKRTKPFYILQFEALKALTAPEVCRD